MRLRVPDPAERRRASARTVEERENTIKRGGLTIQTAIDPKTQDRPSGAVRQGRRPEGPGDLDHEHDPAGHRSDHRHGAEPPGDGQQRQEGRDLLEPGPSSRRWAASRATRPGRPSRRSPRRPRWRRASRCSKKFNARSPMNFAGKSFETCEGREQVYGKWKVHELHRQQRQAMDMYEGAADVGEHLLRPARAGRRHVPGDQDGREARRQARHAGTATSSTTTRTSRRSPWARSRSARCRWPRRTRRSPPGASTATRSIIAKITTRTGKKLDVPDANCKRVMSKDVADGMNKLLASVMTKGTGARARTSDGRPQAGKTGTIDSNEAVWFAGYTPEIAGVAMISIDNTQQAVHAQARRDSGAAASRATGCRRRASTWRAPAAATPGMKIWKPAMERVSAERSRRPASRAPPSRIESGKRSGARASSGWRSGRDAGSWRRPASPSRAQLRLQRRRPAGRLPRLVAGTGARAPQFGTIYATLLPGPRPGGRRGRAP